MLMYRLGNYTSPFRVMIAAFAAMVVVFFIVPQDLLAQATEAAAVTYKVDFGPFIVTYVLPALGTIILMLAAWASKKLADYLGLKNDDIWRENLNTSIKHGLALAQAQLQAAANAGKLSVETKNELVAKAMIYAIEHEPAAVKALGYDEKTLMEKIRAHLELNIVPAIDSVAVPAPPNVKVKL